MKKVRNKRFFTVAASLVTVLALLTGVLIYKLQRDYLSSKGLPVPNPLAALFKEEANETARLGELTANQLMQKLIDASSNRASTMEVYQSIPSTQLDDLSFESFDQYISALRKVMNQSELSFWPMSSDERSATQKTIIRISDDLAKKTETAAFYWVKPLSGTAKKLPIFLAKNAEGSYYLSGPWIRSCLSIYNYGKFYFSTVRNEDTESLGAIVTSGSNDQEVRTLKAKRTLSYYRQVLFGQMDAYEILTWRMDLMIIRQKILPQYNGKSGAQYINKYEELDLGLGPQLSNTRLVYVIATAEGEYQVRDLIPHDFKTEDFRVLLKNEYTLMPGDLVSSESLINAFGQILSMKVTNNSSSVANNASYTLLFNNAHLLLKNVSFDGENNFTAVLDNITLLSAAYPIEASSLHVGQNVDDLLRVYPFLDMYSYVAVDQNGKFFANYVIREGEIKAIVVGLLSSGPSGLGKLFTPDLQNTSEGIPTPAPTMSPTPIPPPKPSPTPLPSETAAVGVEAAS